jgi:hypothetical protein
LRLQTESGRTAGRTRPSEGGITDADLAALIDAWPALPRNVREAIALLARMASR